MCIVSEEPETRLSNQLRIVKEPLFFILYDYGSYLTAKMWKRPFLAVAVCCSRFKHSKHLPSDNPSLQA